MLAAAAAAAGPMCLQVASGILQGGGFHVETGAPCAAAGLQVAAVGRQVAAVGLQVLAREPTNLGLQLGFVVHS